MPELDRTSRDGTVQRARLDNRVEGGPGAPVQLLDHMVVHPTAASSVRAAAEEDGAAPRPQSAAEGVHGGAASNGVVGISS